MNGKKYKSMVEGGGVVGTGVEGDGVVVCVVYCEMPEEL